MYVPDPHLRDDALDRLADALFCSELATGSSVTARAVAAEVRASLARRRSWDACMRVVAEAHVEDATAAAQRLAWARQTVARAVHGDATEAR